MNPFFLENRRADNTAKCANCAQWAGRDTEASAAECELHKMTTLDLLACSSWMPHEVHTGRILKPDETIDAD